MTSISLQHVLYCSFFFNFWRNTDPTIHPDSSVTLSAEFRRKMSNWKLEGRFMVACYMQIHTHFMFNVYRFFFCFIFFLFVFMVLRPSLLSWMADLYQTRNKIIAEGLWIWRSLKNNVFHPWIWIYIFALKSVTHFNISVWSYGVIKWICRNIKLDEFSKSRTFWA